MPPVSLAILALAWGETPPRGATQVGQGRLAVSTNWEAEARLRTRDDMAKSVDQSLETGASPVANWAPNQVLARERRKTFVALSQLKALGEQAVIAVAASLARGGPIVRGQLIASHFYEALRYELKRSPMHDTQRAALMAASDQCEP